MNFNTESKSKNDILIVDDSIVIKNHTHRLVKAIAGVGNIYLASNGQEAINVLQENPSINIIILDIQMPIMDGMVALPRLLKINPKAKIIISSTLSVKGAEITLQALALGACEYITKPSPAVFQFSIEDFERELTQKVVGLLIKETPTKNALPSRSVPARSALPLFPQALVIGSSTGGPAALLSILTGLNQIKIPIFIVQHMPPIFTALLAENIQKSSGIKTVEVIECQPLTENCIYLAAGGYHLEVSSKNAQVSLEVNTNPPQNFCRPSVTPLFSSAAKVYKNRLLGCMLTGIGNDGLDGARDIIDAGGGMVVQDEASSIVWGMPRAVYEAGLATQVMSLSNIKELIHKITK
ncbi:MAG: chemotaxis-specific protein-glutamate methyltransferase CheB [Alphaproteobacteria bacterium]|nr:chemotaxis-specific protein-glutamate methyltransferase CheB [Alphaproteobacteria bacterium]